MFWGFFFIGVVYGERKTRVSTRLGEYSMAFNHTFHGYFVKLNEGTVSVTLRHHFQPPAV